MRDFNLHFLSTAFTDMSVALSQYKAGNIANKVHFWLTMTSDKKILDIVRGYQIELDAIPSQSFIPSPYVFSHEHTHAIDQEIAQLLAKGVIAPTHLSNEGFVSNIFFREKKNGSIRIILDLKEFNDSVTYHHFKMDGLLSAINLMTPNCLMASIDWKDAYYSVPIDQKFREFLKFSWKGVFYQYTCLPNGLASAPRIFTKLTKVLFSYLRKQGVNCVSYIDDCLLVAHDKTACEQSVLKTVHAFMSLNVKNAHEQWYVKNTIFCT